MLTLDYVFTQPQNFNRTRRQRECAGVAADKPLFTTSRVMTARQFLRHVAQLRTYHDCQRQMATEQKKERLCQPGLKRKEAPGNPMLPVPIVHGCWMLFADSRPQYVEPSGMVR